MDGLKFINTYLNFEILCYRIFVTQRHTVHSLLMLFEQNSDDTN